MCILFLCINNNVVEADEYQVVIAMNRDEFIDRPTLPAHFWNEHCISGMDAQPGRKGGTWFGVSSKFAKIGALLNISEPVIDTSKRARGHLVSDYLLSDLDAASYIKTIAPQQHEYNRLNLALLERRAGDWFVHYLSNEDSKSPRQLAAGVQVISNSMIDRPWQKVAKGREKFEQIVSRHRRKCTSAELKADLMSMLSDCSSNMPDPVLELQLSGSQLCGPDAGVNVLTGPDALIRRSAIFVDLFDTARYGTRTHTLLLVDKAGTCEYVETTMGSDAISADHSFLPDKNVLVKGERPSDWRTSQFDFCFR